MTRANWKERIHRLVVSMGLTSMLIAAAFGQIVRADVDDENLGNLVGPWGVTVTLRDCATGSPQGSFLSLVSFHRGGTLSESSGGVAFQPGQRSEGHGAWERLGRWTFSQHVIGLLRFSTAPNIPGTPTFDPAKPDSPGFSAGTQTISHMVRLTGANSFESAGTSAFFDSNGQSYRTVCSTAVGQRFE